MADATTTSTSTPSQQLSENYGYLSDQAKALQQNEYVPYTGELVPELTQGQKDAIAQTQANANSAAAGYGTAQGTTTGAINDINANKNVYQPYFNSALGATNNALNQATTNANLAQSGYNTAQGNTASAYANTLANANLAQPGYNTAQGTTTNALNANQNAANLGLSGYNTAQGNTADAYANTLTNANAAQPGYQTAFGSADAAGNIIAAGRNVAQPYMASAQNMANAAMPGYGEAASAATAGMTPLEQATYAAQPAYQHAMAGTDAASQGYNAANYQSGIQGYLSPYLQNVVNATAAQMQNINQQQQQQMLGSAIGSGAFGGDRANIGLGALQNQQNLALGQTIGGLLQSGYQNAAQNYMTGLQQQGVLANQYGQLGGQAQQALINAGLAREQGAANISNIAGQRMTGATQYGALGTAAQNAALQGAGLEQANAALYGQLATGKQTALMQASAQEANIANQQAAQANAQQLAAQQSAALTGQLGAQQGSLAGAQQTAALQGALQQANIANQQGTLAGQQQNAAMQSAALQGTLGAQYGTLGTAAQNAALAAPALALQAGAQQGTLAGNAQASSLAGSAAALNANNVDYAQKLQADAAKYTQDRAAQAYPMQMLNETAGIMYGAPNMGSTSTTTTPVGNDISSWLGLGTSLLGFLSASDERLKDNMHPIGKSFDGQTIYRFNYKGDPKTQVGFSAQEVEKHHPEAVYKNEDGVRFVNYDQATHHAASKGHFHLGGSASMGGLVPESMERHHYAQGGIGDMPYTDDPLMGSMLAKSGLDVASYVPKRDKINPQKPYQLVSAPIYRPEKMDLSGVGGFLNAGKKFYNSLSPSPAVAASIAAQSSDVANLGSDIGSYSLGLNYSNGGLVPRTYHADGEDTPMDDSKTVSADTSGGGLSSVFSGLGGIIPSIFNKGEPLSDDARMSIIAAGLATAAGTSPSALANIGQGGLAGLQTYANQKKMQYDYQKAQAEQDINRRRVAVEEAGVPIEQRKLGIQERANALKMFEDWSAMYTEGTKPDPTDPNNPIKYIKVYKDLYGNEISQQEYQRRKAQALVASGLSPAMFGVPDISTVRSGHASGGLAGSMDDGLGGENNDDTKINITSKPTFSPDLGIDDLVKSALRPSDIADTNSKAGRTKVAQVVPKTVKDFSGNEYPVSELPPPLQQIEVYKDQANQLDAGALNRPFDPVGQKSFNEKASALRNMAQSLSDRTYYTDEKVPVKYVLGSQIAENLPPPPVDKEPRGQIDDDTGAIKAAPVNIGYAHTGGLPTSPIPKHAVLAGEDPIYSSSKAESSKAETEFLNSADPLKMAEAKATLVKYAAASKILETGALTKDATTLAAYAKSLGFDQIADKLALNKDIGQAQIALKASIDQAIQTVSSSFTRPTQSEFGIIQSKDSPDPDSQPETNHSIVATRLAATLKQDALRNAWLEAKANGAQNFQAFQNRWSAQHGREMFEDSANRLLGNFKGDNSDLNQSKFVDGGVYVLPENKSGKNQSDLEIALYKQKDTQGNPIFQPGDIVQLQGVHHYIGEDKESHVKMENVVRLDPNQVYSAMLKQPGLGLGR